MAYGPAKWVGRSANPGRFGVLSLARHLLKNVYSLSHISIKLAMPQNIERKSEPAGQFDLSRPICTLFIIFCVGTKINYAIRQHFNSWHIIYLCLEYALELVLLQILFSFLLCGFVPQLKVFSPKLKSFIHMEKLISVTSRIRDSRTFAVSMTTFCFWIFLLVCLCMWCHCKLYYHCEPQRISWTNIRIYVNFISVVLTQSNILRAFSHLHNYIGPNS